jgi:hypothetical protein
MTSATSDPGRVRVSGPGTLVANDMEACARALVAADEEHVREAMNTVRWERRGVLQRLVRLPR